MDRPIVRITGGVGSVSRNVFGVFALLLVFGMAMGILEAVVVVYARELWYPGNFGFPLAETPREILKAELLREAATLVMLAIVAFLAGRRRLDRFLYFLFTFGVWDIVYYIGLKGFIGWPPSLLTWDVLFLIPVTWVGPVLAPILCSVTMIVMALILVFCEEKGYAPRIDRLGAVMLFGGALVVFTAFIYDFAAMLVASGLSGGDAGFREAAGRYVPESFHWGVFLAGEALIVGFMIRAVNNARRLL